MTQKLKYIIDTSSLTQAYRTYYSFEIAPSFWEFLESQFNSGIITSNDKVYEEIKLGKDKLYDWIKIPKIKTKLINTKSEVKIISHYGHLMQWAESLGQYKTIAKERFAQFENADPWIIACGMEYELTIVSMEVSAPLSKSAIKIPDVCKAFSINHIDTFSFLNEVGFKM